jgi:ATP-dependent helicase/DNAse subunit B
MSDKYSAIWVSYSSISDFLKCPRAYYLKNVYKDKKTGNKIQIITPPLALGQAVHEVIESLSGISTDKRFDKPLVERYEKAWEKVSGKRGGFPNEEVENKYKERGLKMLDRIRKNPGPLKRLTVKIDMELPQYWLSEEDNLMLCGKVDWLEYIPDTDSVHIVDFKTSKEAKENSDSLQLPIYHLLVKNTQKRDVSGASYWYIEQNDEPMEKELPSLEESQEKVMKIAKKLKLARQLGSFECPNGEEGCRECKPFERILNGDGEYVYTDSIRRDIYILPREEDSTEGTLL